MISKRSHTIIVCDDKSDSVSALIECLRDSDYHVITASHGVEAIALYELHRPDLIISNFFMPRLGGVEIVSYLCRSYPAMKSILMTDSVEISRSLIAHQLDAHATVYLIEKSAGTIELVSTVHLMLLHKGRRDQKLNYRASFSERLN
ncbi:MAG: CheY-like chemotaxis protein [Pseudohongiellaceae bacterium]|jgi:CheY-like chemotaxis protein